MLDNIAGNAFLEVDKLVGLGYEKQNGRLSLPRGDVLHPRDRGGYETCISAGSGNGDSRDGNDWPRRPGTNEEYWSTPLNLWLKMSHTRQVVLSHVGEINEAPEGEQAPGEDCKQCAKNGAECMVYSAENTWKGSQSSRIRL